MCFRCLNVEMPFMEKYIKTTTVNRCARLLQVKSQESRPLKWIEVRDCVFNIANVEDILSIFATKSAYDWVVEFEGRQTEIHG